MAFRNSLGHVQRESNLREEFRASPVLGSVNSGKAIWWYVYPRREMQSWKCASVQIEEMPVGFAPRTQGSAAGILREELEGHGAYGYSKFDFWLVVCSYPCMMRGILRGKALMATQDLNSVRHVLVVPNRTRAIKIRDVKEQSRRKSPIKM